jgi:nucleotide-binding universal stress UspA family protein
MYKHILSPSDGSATSERGLQEAIALARDQGARLRLLHVIDPYVPIIDPMFAAGVADMRQAMLPAANELLAKAQARAREGGVEATVTVRETFENRAAGAIVAEASEAGCDLIVMGTHGRRGFKQLALGSDAQIVLRTSPVPVLLVRAQEGPSR